MYAAKPSDALPAALVPAAFGTAPNTAAAVNALSEASHEALASSADRSQHDSAGELNFLLIEACLEELSVVAVLAALAQEADETKSALPPLWPRVLHFITDLALPLNPAAPLDVKLIPRFVRALRSKIHSQRHAGAQGIREVLFGDPSNVTEVINACAVPLLAKLLKKDELPAVQFEAASALAKVTSSTTEQPAIMLNTPDLMKNLVKLLGSPHTDICGLAAYALGNVEGEFTRFRDIVLEHGVIAELIRLLKLTKIKTVLRRHLMLIALKMCRGDPPPRFSAIEAVIPVVIEMTQFSDREVMALALWTLSRITEGSGDRIAAVMRYGALPAVMRHLSSTDRTILLRCASSAAWLPGMIKIQRW
jgi:hypothetical protein